MRGLRSVDQWKSALMALPEKSFFELLRSVLGNIKTPFSKQKLMNDLVALLSKPDIQKVIKVYIDEQDHKLIAAIALLDEPAAEDLESFFSGEISGAELHALLINLEERFILFRYKDDGVLRLALNPVLEGVLAPFIADTKLLFPSSTIEITGSTNNSIVSSRVLAAIFAFILGKEELLKTDKGLALKRKILDEAKKIFPGMDIDLAIRILVKLDLCRIEANYLVLNKEKIADYSNLSLIEKQSYWIAAMHLCQKESSESDFPDEDVFFRRRLRFIASLIQVYRTLVEPGKGYPEITLKRLRDLIKKDSRTEYRDAQLSLEAQFPQEELLVLMEKAGLLQKAGDCWTSSAVPYSPIADSTEPVIIMDSAFSIILLPEISFTDAIMLSAFCSVKECTESTVKFELTRTAAVRGFDEGMEAAAMLELLERLSGNRLDANIGWTIKEWESRYTEVSLYQGIILTLAEEHRYLAEAGPVSSLIQKILTPGVYLLSATDRTEAVKALQKAGIDIVAQPLATAESGGKRAGRSDLFGALSRTYNRDAYPRLEGASSHLKKALNFANDKESGEDAADAQGTEIRENFRKILEKMKLAKHEQDELHARIDRRLVLSKAQLEAKSLKYEKLEAKGLDYAGKSLIAKQAIDAGSLVEVTWPSPEGELNRIIGMPISLEKKEGDSILICRTGEGPEDAARVLRIPLRKISLLRRIKKSLFKE